MTKQERLDAYLAENDLEAVWFARPNSFAWLTGGSNVVDREGDAGVAAVGYDGDGLEVVTNNIEADRLRDEELPEDVPVTEFDWYRQSLGEAVADRSPDPAAADFDAPGLQSVDASPLRQPLTDEDVENYRELGRETAEAVEAVCRELQPGDTESEVASALRVALSARGIEAPVALVGGSERAGKYRHYTPTDAELGEYALVSVTAERHGLHASTTRTVAFESEMDDADLNELGERHHAARIVAVTALGATQAISGLSGDPTGVFQAIQAAYEHLGHADEWERHHQGGAAGFAGREWIAAPEMAESAEVTTPMAYAWNPTVQGAKSEDTVLVTEDGFEVLTDTGRWPTTAVDAYDYDAVIECPDVLVQEDEGE
ncbi:Xaa-Pro peptidase family protein [Halorussus sp. MSC15.2]|uniref:M24 family metallopeptidase n=1 Tax=Halorussus sp. MSC15.2 TaxID=2283638 RepID=UPI0013D18451|nr:M24 family metallopeptidase [Halorussus sp. MSC15.2]NEU56081.1 M24 family metallopeptidase [Halorussus sp. MSC15.2]